MLEFSGTEKDLQNRIKKVFKNKFKLENLTLKGKSFPLTTLNQGAVTVALPIKMTCIETKKTSNSLVIIEF